MQEPIAIGNAIVVGVTAVLSYLGFQNAALREQCLFSSTGILGRREYYRMVSSGFIHADWPHLLFNMFSLYSFGRWIEQLFGLHVFLLIYFGSMIGGSLLALFLHRHEDYRAVGASGGVCGVIFAVTFLLPGSSIYVFLIPVPIPAWLYAIVFIVVSARGIHSQVGSIGHEAHLGGAFSGLLVTTILQPGIIHQNPLLYGVVMAMVLGFLGYVVLRQSGSSAIEETDPMEDSQFIEQVREKVAKHGMDSLTPAEKKRLRSMAGKEE